MLIFGVGQCCFQFFFVGYGIAYRSVIGVVNIHNFIIIVTEFGIEAAAAVCHLQIVDATKSRVVKHHNIDFFVILQSGY
ncbi:hypothetical protein D3C74_322040 [compost metagenome]